MKINVSLLLGVLLVWASPAIASAAVTCVANKTTGKFEAVDKSPYAKDECEGKAAGDLLASFADAQGASEAAGTKVIGGVIVTNTNNFSAALSSRQAIQAQRTEELRLQALEKASQEAAQASARRDWEILAVDGTLQTTIERWAKTANWQVHWKDIPEIRNPGYVKLPDRDFLSVADYVLSRAKSAAKAVGVEIVITAYPNKVLVISKESQK